MPTKPQIERRARVLQFLKEHPEGGSARSVSEALGMHYTTANDDLHILHNEGLLVQSTQDRVRIWEAL